MSLNKPALQLLKHEDIAAAPVSNQLNHICGVGGSLHESAADPNK